MDLHKIAGFLSGAARALLRAKVAGKKLNRAAIFAGAACLRLSIVLLAGKACIIFRKHFDFMKFKIDLHVHSLYSTDNNSDPEESILRAIELGFDGVAFTEHYYYGASEPIELLKEKYGSTIRIFRGVEFSAAEGHCLIFGADTDKLGMRSAALADVVRFVSEAGGVVIPSHPYRPGTSIGDLALTAGGIAALEGCNGGNMHAFNVKAIETAKARRLPYTGGSDAHAPREVGSCYTEFDDTVTYENFIELLRAGNYRGVDTRKISKFLQRF